MYHPQYKQKTLQLALMLAFNTGLTFSAFAADATQASQPVTRQYHIPAGELATSLQIVASESGLTLTFTPEQTAGKQSRPLHGSYTAEQAFEILLEGSGLAAKKNQSQQYSLIKTPAPAVAPANNSRNSHEPQTLPDVQVSDKTETSSTVQLQQEGKAAKGYKVDSISSVGVLAKMKLQDTPFAISVMPQELIQNIQAQSPDDIYKLNPSTRTTTPQITGFSPNVNIRGFDGYNTAENGLRRPYNHAATMEDKERVEILNGLSGFLYGAASPGGMVNFVYKRPTIARLNNVSVGNYGGDQYYVHGDFGGRIDEEGNAGYRLNIVKQNGGTAIDHQGIQRELVSGAIDWQVTDKLLLELNAIYNHYRTEAPSAYWFVAPGLSRPSAPDADRLWAQKWGSDEFHNIKLLSKIHYQLNDNVSLRGAYMRDYIDRKASAGVYNYPSSATAYTQLALAGDDSSDVFNAGQLFADIHFDTWNVAHKVTTGYYMNSDLFRGSNYNSGSFNFGPFSFDRPSYVTKPAFAADTSGNFTKGRDINENFVIGDLITLNDQWSVLAGVNRSRLLSYSYSDPGVQSSSYDQSRTSPVTSLLYKPAPWLTSYLSYIEGLESGGRAPNDVSYINRNQTMSPMVSRQQELGIKASVGNLLLTSAIFEIEKAYQYTEITGAGNLYRQDGRQNHKGIEFGATGKLTDQWTIITGLTLLDPTIKKSALDGKEPINVAKQLAKIYSEYTLDEMPDLTLTAGVYFTGKQYADDANTDRLPSVVTADIGARYKTMLSNHPLTLRLNINNMFDKSYWLNSYYIGAPRTVAFSANLQF
ncbi:MAG: TonB-dependent siderophore receptor [Methylophilus sp.]|uniref:TonB-dependent siderophore receptor n=1 Tax=Methylophilus sp. TaxID=29541 RepID=UPI003F9FD740